MRASIRKSYKSLAAMIEYFFPVCLYFLVKKFASIVREIKEVLTACVKHEVLFAHFDQVAGK